MYRKLIYLVSFLLALGAVSNAPLLGQLSDPYPPDGATGVPLNVTLRWEISEEFDWQEVYLGTDYDDVYVARDWSDEYESYLYSWEDNYQPYGLEPGTTYYWKIAGYQKVGEFIIVSESSVWEFTTGLAKATNPYPANGATDVDPNMVLSWTPGCMADVHDVYLGTNFDEVANADTTTTGIYRGCLYTHSYDPGTLEPGTDYYWRTDEVNNLEPDSPWKGDVWNFTTAKASESGTILFSDDFESYALGTFPSAGGWELIWNGKGTEHQVVSDAYSFTGEKSLQLWGRPNWSSVAQRKFSTDAPVIGYECAIRIDSIGTGGPGREEAVCFFNREAYIWGRGYAVVLFNHDDGEIKAEDGTVLGNWEPGVWYQVKVILDRRVNTYDVWIDGQFKEELLSTTYNDTESIDAVALMSDHAGVKVYYDDVRVFEVHAQPQLLANQDVGNPALAGTVSYDATSDAWTVVGGGNDIGGTSDQFHYAYRPLAGDGEATVRVVSMDVTHEWAKAGVMIRETLDSNSEHAMIAMTGTHGVQTVWRQETGGSSDDATTGGVSAPCWIRIERVGDTINTYYSPDGLVWIPQQSLNIPMNETVYIGMGVVSRQSDSLATAVFDQVTLTAPDYNLAWAPIPADGAIVDPIGVTLSWMPGDNAASHDVYFGVNQTDVDNADTTTTGIYRGRQDANSYDPGTLEPGTTYFWRIDDVNNLDPDSPWKGNVWDFTTVPYIKVRDLKEPTQKLVLKVNIKDLALVWNGDLGYETLRGRGEVYISIWIFWPSDVEKPPNPQHHELGPLGGDQEFKSGELVKDQHGRLAIKLAVVKDKQFGQVYFNKADCPVANKIWVEALVWDEDSGTDLSAYKKLVQAALKVAKAKPDVSIAAEAITALIDYLTESEDDALGRANEAVEIATEEEISDLCECRSGDEISKILEIKLENLITQDMWKDAKDENGRNLTEFLPQVLDLGHSGILRLETTIGKIAGKKSSHERADATSSTQLSCVDLGQPDESIITGVLALGAPLLSDSISRQYSMFLDVDNNLATGAQGYPYDGAEFEMVAEFDNSENPTYKLMQYSSNTGTFEEVPGGLYDGAVNIDGRAIFLQVELSSLGDPVGPIAGWGVVHEQGVVVDVLPEHPEQLALGLTPTYTFTGVPPMLVSTNPPHDAIDVDRETSIEVVFSKSMARPEAETAFSMNPPVDGSFAWQGNTLIFIPSGPLEPMTRYEVTIVATATDRVGTLFDGNGDLTTGDSFSWEFISAGRPLLCCDVDGVEWDVFCEGEPIYVTGTEFDPSSEVEIYIVRHARAEFIPGAELIDVTDTGSNRASIDAEGVLPATLVSSITDEGEYNIIVDVNSNGLFDPGIDRCDKTGIGFAVLPGSRLVGDLNDDGVVGYLDIEILTKEWLDGNDVQSDLNEDSKVDFKDYATLANAWLEDRLWPCETCVQEVSHVEFHQINWYDPNGVLVQENSLWGRMSFSYYPGDTTSYLNVTLANSLGGAEAWVVQNLPLFAVDNGDYSRRGEAVDVNLVELGMIQGQDWPAVYWKLSVDRSIRTEALTEPNIFGIVEDLDRFACDSMDDTPEPGPFTDAGTPKGIKLDKAPVKESKSRDVKGVQEGRKKCCAGSFARSVDWLNREHRLGIGRTAQQIYDDLIAKGVSDKSVSITGRGLVTEWINRKNDYARQKTGNKIVTKVWDPNRSVDPIDGVNETNGDFATWLKNELKHGEDVELAYYYPGSAHIVTVLEVYTKDGDTYVKYRDDEHQGDNSKGDKKVKHKKIYKKDGKYHFGADSNTIYFAVSESPDKNQNGIGDGFE